jgi:hypothetical protein
MGLAATCLPKAAIGGELELTWHLYVFLATMYPSLTVLTVLVPYQSRSIAM